MIPTGIELFPFHVPLPGLLALEPTFPIGGWSRSRTCRWAKRMGRSRCHLMGGAVTTFLTLTGAPGTEIRIGDGGTSTRTGENAYFLQ